MHSNTANLTNMEFTRTSRLSVTMVSDGDSIIADRIPRRRNHNISSGSAGYGKRSVAEAAALDEDMEDTFMNGEPKKKKTRGCT